MIQALKKNAIFLFYAALNGFLTASGYTLAFTVISSGTSVLERTNIFLISSVEKINTVALTAAFICFTVVFFLLFFLRDRLYRQTLPFSLLFFSFCVLTCATTELSYLTVILAAAAAILVYVFKETFPGKEYKLLSGINLYVLLGILTVIMTLILSLGCISRMYDFNTSTYDFGIFAQMYESMARDFTQTTTLERGIPMSHFNIHFSPIYYVLLPFYMIFRRPEFLLAAQAAVCLSGIIPVLLLCKRYKYGNTVTFFCGLIFLCYPAFTCACFYDFHENAFLTPLVLWLMYFIEKNSLAGCVVSGLLLLCVKEDAGVYLIIAGLYALVGKNIHKEPRVNAQSPHSKKRTKSADYVKSRFSQWFPKYLGLMLIFMGISGFLLVTAFINTYGDGIMIGRYQIFLGSGQDSITDVIFNIIKNPAFFLNNILDEEKLLLIVQMLLPLLFIPMKSRRLSDWVLFIPLILFNLATDYSYQHSIHYQYVFSTGAFLIFLFVKNFRYEKRKNKTAAAALLAAVICLIGTGTPKYYNIVFARESRIEYDESRAALANVPRDGVVYSSTYLTPYLYDCENVYMYPAIYNQETLPPADCVVLDNRAGVLKEYYELKDMFMEMGYVEEGSGGFVTVLLKK